MAACRCGYSRLLQLSPQLCVPPTFLRSAAFRGENDENRQDENPGPCRSPAHHYRSAHSSLQSECIMLASGPAAPLQPVPKEGGGGDTNKKKKTPIFNTSKANPRVDALRLSFNNPVVSDSLTMEVTTPQTYTHTHLHTSKLWSYFLH